jgi:hypothetical protein
MHTDNAQQQFSNQTGIEKKNIKNERASIRQTPHDYPQQRVVIRIRTESLPTIQTFTHKFLLSAVNHVQPNCIVWQEIPRLVKSVSHYHHADNRP